MKTIYSKGKYEITYENGKRVKFLTAKGIKQLHENMIPLNIKSWKILDATPCGVAYKGGIA